MAVLDHEPFEKLCPSPRAPVVIRRGGERSQNVEDPSYVTAVQEHGQRRTAWVVLTSYRLGTPTLEWDTVDYADPNTWTGYMDELRAAGFTEIEVVRVIRTAMTANALDDAKLDAARETFLRREAAERTAASSSPADAPSGTPSGGPASGPESDTRG